MVKEDDEGIIFFDFKLDITNESISWELLVKCFNEESFKVFDVKD